MVTYGTAIRNLFIISIMSIDDLIETVTISQSHGSDIYVEFEGQLYSIKGVFKDSEKDIIIIADPDKPQYY